MTTRIFPLRATVLAIGILASAFVSRDGCAAETERHEISFTVHKLREDNVEGPDVERTYFTAGSKRIVFGEPKGCRLTFDDNGLLILLTDAHLDGEIHVSRSTFTPGLDLAENALIYRDAASKGSPKGATEITVQQPEMDPYPYNGWKSLGFTWTYSLFGRQMIRTVSYINLRIGEQIVVTTLSGKRDDAKVREIARQFMSSWWVMSR
ncbi:MAG: hypothetical protein ABI318_09095 [Chthoniobacteraceae bacterium]